MPNFGQVTISDQRIVGNGGAMIDDLDLIQAAIAQPDYQDFLDFQDQRTQICRIIGADDLESAVVTPSTAEYKIPKIDSESQVGGYEHRFAVQGKIDVPCEILSQIGSTDGSGNFQLQLAQNYIYPGAHARMYSGNSFRCESVTGTPGNYVASFSSIDGTIFDYATDVAVQSGTKTLSVTDTSYQHGSPQGYGYHVTPKTFAVHTTIQRAEQPLTGNMLTQKTWYYFTTATGKTVQTYVSNVIAQCRHRLHTQNEYKKKHGISNMKNADGTVKSVPPTDATGNTLVIGDGFFTQGKGVNYSLASGLDGMFTADDIRDKVSKIVQESNTDMGLEMFVLCGSDAFYHAQDVLPEFNKNQGVQLMKDITNDKAVGGTKGITGQLFSRADIAGNTVYFILDPAQDNKVHFSAVNSYGKNVESSTLYFCVLKENGKTKKNMAIMSNGADGSSRASLNVILSGMSGGSSAVTQADRKIYSYLMEDLALLRNAGLFGVIKPQP